MLESIFHTRIPRCVNKSLELLLTFHCASSSSLAPNQGEELNSPSRPTSPALPSSATPVDLGEGTDSSRRRGWLFTPTTSWLLALGDEVGKTRESCLRFSTKMRPIFSPKRGVYCSRLMLPASPGSARQWHLLPGALSLALCTTVPIFT